MNTFEEAEKTLRAHADQWLRHPLYTLVFYGSRVRGYAEIDSDWDVVAFTLAPPDYENRRQISDLKLDILEVSWAGANQPAWLAREICAMLMCDRGGYWTEPQYRPVWEPNWDAIIDRKMTSVAHNSGRTVERIKQHGFTDPIRKYMPLLRRRAQRVIWMMDLRDIPSRPELDQAWEKLNHQQRGLLLRRAGVHPQLIYRLIAY